MNGIAKSLAVGVAVGIAALYLTEAVRYCVRLLKWLPGHERWVRGSKGLCANCGYDLTSNVSRRCPECGEITHGKGHDGQPGITPSLMTQTQPWWVWVVVAATMALAVILQRWLSP